MTSGVQQRLSCLLTFKYAQLVQVEDEESSGR